MTRYVADRTDWLVRRELVRRRRDLLRDAATGQRPAWPADDLPDAETNPYPDSRGPATSTRVRGIAAGTEARNVRMLGAGSSLTVSPQASHLRLGACRRCRRPDGTERADSDRTAGPTAPATSLSGVLGQRRQPADCHG